MTRRDESSGKVIPFVAASGASRQGPDAPRAAERILSHDWSETPLGAMEGWGEGRRAVVDLILSSAVPTIGLWGRELVQISNDAALVLVGAGEQLRIGRSAMEAWPRDWPQAEALERAGQGETLSFDTVPDLARLTYASLRTQGEPLPVVLVHAIPLPSRPAPQDRDSELRTRNTLALMRSIVARSAPLSADVEEYAMHLLGRIEAIVRVQIASSVAADGIEMAALVADELLGAGAHEGGAVSIEGPPFRLALRAAEKIGLAIHELATNALKFGALAVDGGHVAIAWRLEEGREPSLVLDWIESGVEGPVERQRKGFGGELIERALPYELSATTVLDFRQGGVRCTIRLPVSKISAHW